MSSRAAAVTVDVLGSFGVARFLDDLTFFSFFFVSPLLLSSQLSECLLSFRYVISEVISSLRRLVDTLAVFAVSAGFGFFGLLTRFNSLAFVFRVAVEFDRFLFTWLPL